MTQYTVTVDWKQIHSAFSTLDKARRSAAQTEVVPGTEALSDALGGSYVGATFQQDGLAGLVRLVESLQKITMHAWGLVHRAARDSRSNSHRREDIESYVRACVRTMLAARHCHDLLVAAGVMRHEPETIPRGHDDHHVFLTGLRWLAGHPQDDGQVTVEEAIAIAEGAPFSTIPTFNPNARREQL